jgi:hypothetical protein
MTVPYYAIALEPVNRQYTGGLHGPVARVDAAVRRPPDDETTGLLKEVGEVFMTGRRTREVTPAWRSFQRHWTVRAEQLPTAQWDEPTLAQSQGRSVISSSAFRW